jgi:hypothetical protein
VLTDAGSIPAASTINVGRASGRPFVGATANNNTDYVGGAAAGALDCSAWNLAE